MEGESVIDNALSNYPIVQTFHILVVLISFPPVIIFLFQISKIALHDNCKFLLRAWGSSFVLCLIMHGLYIMCDLITGKYIPETNHEPSIRLIIFGFHGFSHAMSSCQELMLSLERAVSCASPEQYHNQGLSKRMLFVAELIAVRSLLLALRMNPVLQLVPSVAYLWQISNDQVAVASCITNSIDFASLICLLCTTYYVIRRKKFIVNSSLNEKYQIKEALDITRVMLPCGVISLAMKVSSTLAAIIYSLGVIDSKYMFTITGGTYLIIESLNCMICSTVVLSKHAGLRRLTRQMFCSRAAAVEDVRSATEVKEIYFTALRRDWD